MMNDDQFTEAADDFDTEALRQLQPTGSGIDQRELFYRAGFAAAQQEATRSSRRTASRPPWRAIVLAATLSAMVAIPFGMQIGRQSLRQSLASQVIEPDAGLDLPSGSSGALAVSETDSQSSADAFQSNSQDNRSHAAIPPDDAVPAPLPRDLVTPRKTRFAPLIFASQSPSTQSTTLAAYHSKALAELGLLQSLPRTAFFATSADNPADLAQPRPSTLTVRDTSGVALPR